MVGAMYTRTQGIVIGCSILIALYGILYGEYLTTWIPKQGTMLTIHEQTQLLRSLVYHVNQTDSFQPRPRLAFCCSADLDVSVRAVDLMKRIDLKTKQNKKKKKNTIDRKHHERIGNLHELQESFVYYFSNGAAAEQSMNSPEQFREIVKYANELSHVKHKVGGNAATMADRASIEGCPVLLGAAIGKEMRKHFNDKIQLVGHLQDHEHEDVHLVLEYAKGDGFHGHTTPRANRYYLNHDIYNARLSVLEEFEQALETFQPDLVVIGGLQLMEVETDEERRLKRLHKLSEVLQNLFVSKIPTHYEFAAVSDFTLFDDTVRLVLPWVHSIGLNEQELFILHHYLITGEQATATTSRPTISQVSLQISQVIQYAAKARAFYQSKSYQNEPHRKAALAQLTRIHFHTLQFHIICQQENSGWKDPKTALIQSALMSTKLACGQDTSMRPSYEMEIDPERIEILIPRQFVLKQQEYKTIDPFSPIIEWKEYDFQCFMVPMLACKQPDHTAGLGDNISGTGMAYHGQNRNN